MMPTNGFHVDKATAPYRASLLRRNYQLSLIKGKMAYIPLTRSEKIFRLSSGGVLLLLGISLMFLSSFSIYSAQRASVGLVMLVVLGLVLPIIGGCIVRFSLSIQDNNVRIDVNNLIKQHEAFTDIIKPHLDNLSGRRDVSRYLRSEQKGFASKMREHEILSEKKEAGIVSTH